MGGTLNCYYGDLHNHCDISYAHGDLRSALSNARRQLDFCSVTGHAAWPDMPEPDERIAYIIEFHQKGFAKLKEGWGDYLATVEEFNQEGSFLVFPGYEVHSCLEGDYTFVYQGLEGPLVVGESIAEIKRKLDGVDVLAFPHHLGYPQGSRGINWGLFDPKLSPLVEILSMHGVSESCESPRPFYHSMGPLDYESTVQYGLSVGQRVGFLGNTDHHSAHPGSYGHGRSGVWARSLTRKDLWDALMARRTFALTGDRMRIAFFVNEAPMGAVVPRRSKNEVRFRVEAGYALDRVEVVKDGSVLRRFFPSPSETAATFSTQLHLELGWGERHKAHRWEGSVAVRGGRITGLETRFRGAEVVSPVEQEGKVRLPYLNGEATHSDNEARFTVVSGGNPTNTTPATQGLNLHLEVTEDSEIELLVGGQSFRVPVSRLLRGSYARNLGLIDSPAFRFHRLPLPWELALSESLTHQGEAGYYYLRVFQKNGQLGYTSPVFLE